MWLVVVVTENGLFPPRLFSLLGFLRRIAASSLRRAKENAHNPVADFVKVGIALYVFLMGKRRAKEEEEEEQKRTKEEEKIGVGVGAVRGRSGGGEKKKERKKEKPTNKNKQTRAV